AHLWTDVRVPDAAAAERRLAARAADRLEGVHARERAGLLTRLAPRAAQPELVHEVEAPERLVRDDPGRRELRVDERIERATERRVVVEAERARQEQTVVDAELLLHVQP